MTLPFLLSKIQSFNVLKVLLYGTLLLGLFGVSTRVLSQPTDSTYRAISPAVANEQIVRVTIAAVGDLMCHDSQLSAAQQPDGSYNFEPCFNLVAPILLRADLAIGNLETVHAGAKARYTGYPAFNTPDSYSIACQKAGLDILTTANNHSYDRAYTGIRRTLEVLDSLGIPHTGTSHSYKQRAKPLLTQVGGIRLAILAYTYGLNQRVIGKRYPTLVNHLDTANILEDLKFIRSLPPDERPEKILACVHWGNEYRLTPEEHQQKFARWMITQGVDVILGSHPHVVQTVEVIQTKRENEDSATAVIIYSMGNFISGQRTIPRETGVIVGISFERNSTGTVSITDGTITPTYVHKTPGKRPDAYQVLPVPVALEKLKTNPMLYSRDVARRLEEAQQEVLQQFYTAQEFFKIYPPSIVPKNASEQTEQSKPNTGKRNR